MRRERARPGGLGWVGTIGCVAFCVLLFLCVYLTIDGGLPGDEPHRPRIVRLRAVPDAEVQRTPLARPRGWPPRR